MALMAVATGAIVANLYYAQPLLHNVASSFGVGSTAAATVVTVTQVGYAAGLLLVVPLGDLHPRRRPAVILFLGAGAGLVFCAAAPSPLALRDRFCRSGMCIGGRAGHDPLRRRPGARGETWSGSGAHHDRFASRYLARPHRQWARGPGGGVAGWRAIYWISAGLMGSFALVLRKTVPGESARPHVPYRGLVASSLRLLVDEPVLRRRAVLGACAFGAFSVLWTALAFLLSAPSCNYSNAAIGLFGLAGMAGVLAANMAGRMADADHPTTSTLLAGLCSWAPMDS